MSDCFQHIREIIEIGHLTKSFKLNDVSIKIKNPNLQLIDWSEEFSSNLIEKKLILLCRCIISISGIDTRNLHFELYESFINSHSFSILDKLRVYADHTMYIATKANKYLEAFCYTDESRYIWKAWKARSLFTSYKLEDINNLQLSWVIWNEAEDERLESDRDWEKAFFIASASNAKGVESVQKKWKAKDKSEMDRREEVIEMAKKGALEDPSKKKYVQQKNYNRSKSEEELKEEMRKWVAGEEDEHDRAVREHKEEVQNTINEMKRQAEEMKKRNREKRSELENVVTGMSLIGLTEEQIRSRVKKDIFEAPTINEGNKSVIENFFMKPTTTGNLTIEDGEVKGNYTQPSLMDKISNRRPSME